MKRSLIFRGRTLSGAVIILLLMLVTWTGTAGAASLEVEVEKGVLEPGEEIKLMIKLVGDDGEILKVDRQVLVRVNTGGLLEIKQLREGVMLEAGAAEFTYLAPEVPGKAEIRLLDLETRASAVVNFQITAGESPGGDWYEKYATLKEIRGGVFVRSAGEEFYDTARKLQRVYDGDAIQTMKDSWVDLILYDESLIKLEPLTELVIHTLSTLKKDREVKQGIFELVKGKVLCTANDYLSKGSRFTIETESATAGVRGTSFEVIRREDGRIEVIVYEGTVKTTQPETGRVFVVRAGEKMLMPVGDEIPEISEHGLTPEQRQEQIRKEQQAQEPPPSAGKEQGGPKDNGSSNSGGVLKPVPVWEGNVEVNPNWGTGE